MSTPQSSLIDRLLREKEHRPAKDYVSTVKDWYRSQFNKDLPLANIGLSDFHRQKGWEHSRAFDVSLHPDSEAGKRLVSYLQSQGIPYLAQTGAVSRGGRTISTGPHIHVGPPSSSMSKRSLVDRLIEQKSTTSKTDFSQVSAGVSGSRQEPLEHRYQVKPILTDATHSPEAERRSQLRKQIREEQQPGMTIGLPSMKGIDALLHPVTTVRKVFDPEGVMEQEVEERIAAQQRQSSPEVTAIRKEYGRMGSVPTPAGVKVQGRSVAQPLSRAGGNILKLAGGAASLAGLTPNKFSEWANARGRIVEEAASLPPLTEAGEEIVQGLPEKLTTAVADTGLSIAQIILLKKATRLPFGRLMGVEAALRTSDMPLDRRTQEIAKATVLGKVLERHLSRKLSAAAFAGPTAAETGVAVSKGQMSLEDAILQTAVQGGTGAALGGGKKSLVDRMVAEKEAGSEIAKSEGGRTGVPKYAKPVEKAEADIVRPLATEAATQKQSSFDTYAIRAVERLTKQLETEQKPPAEPKTTETPSEPSQQLNKEPLTGIKVDITRTERADRGLDPIQQKAYTAIGESYNTGRSQVEGGSVDPRGLAESVAAQPRPLSKTEIGALGFDRARLSNERTTLYKELDTAIAENRDTSDVQSRLKTVERALDFNDQALEKGGREQSEAFNARKAIVLHDYSLGDVLQRAKAAKGADLTPKERVEYTELQQKYEKVLQQLNETEKKTVTDALQQDINRIAKSQQRTETKELLDAEFSVLQTQFRQARLESRNVQASGLAGVDPEGKLTALVLRMAQNRIKAGVTKAEQLVDDIYNAVKDSVEGLTPDDVRNALKGLPSQRTARLEKQIGEMEAGTWKPTTRERREPTDDEFRLIRRRDDLKRHIEAKLRHDAMSGGERFVRELGNAVGLIRSTMTAIDASFGLRQGKIGLSRHPSLWAEAWKKQWVGVSNEKYDRAVWRIENDPEFPLMGRFGLETPSVAMKHSFSLTAKNEDFPSEWTQRIPVLRQSEQVFNLMGDVLRTSWFKSDMKMLRKAGYDPNNPEHAEMFRHSAASINDYTGRTNLQRLVPGKAGKALHQATPLLNQLTFAIRFWASRLKVLTLPLDPRMYPQIPRTMKLYKSMPRVQRVEAWKTLFSFYGLVSTQLAAAQVAGAEIDTDPDSPDFLKARFTGVSDRHFDVSAGTVNHLRFAARMLKRIYEAKSGQPRKGFNNAPGGVTESYLRSKESPPVSIIHDIFLSRQTKEGQGTNFKGDPVYPFGKPGIGVVGRLKSARLLPKPIVIDDAMEAYDEMGWTGVATTLPFTFLGESATVYKGKKKSKQ